MIGKMRTLAAYLLLAALVVVAVGVIDFSRLLDLSPAAVLLIIPGSLVGLIARAYAASIPLRVENINPGVREWLGLGIYTFLADQVLPLKFGLALRALYLKKRYELAYTKFVGLQTGMNLLALLTTAAVGSMLVLWRFQEYGALLAPYTLALGAFALPLFIRPSRRLGSNGLLQGAMNAYNAFNRLKSHSWVLTRVVMTTVVMLCANVCAMYFALQSFGSSAGLYAASLSVVSIRLMSAVNLTPGNLGVQEFVAAAVLSQLGAAFDDGVLASLIARAMGVVLLVAMAPFFGNVLFGLRAGNEPEQA